VRIAGENELIQTQLDVLRDPISDLFVPTDRSGACAAADQTDPGPQVRVDLQSSSVRPGGEIVSATV
jgi:hypothetical protein